MTLPTRNLLKIITCLLTILLTACSGGMQPKPVWKGEKSVPENHPAPPGFKITPHQAVKQVMDARRLSLKHIWHIYSYRSDYHIIDAFLSPRAKSINHAVIVDGQTGEIKN